jgi:hypothetical protein
MEKSLPPKPSLSLYREHSTSMALDIEHRTYIGTATISELILDIEMRLALRRFTAAECEDSEMTKA